VQGTGGDAILLAGAPDASWHHLVGTFDDGTNVVKLYLDGVMIDSDTQLSTLKDGVSKTIGRSGDENLGYLHSIPDNVRIYNRGLNEQEIKRLYNMGHTN
jgi:hypothetical protein